ncbi:MAG: DUF937 domain-containing protein [Gammaproteobacteria bacterium]|nr:DUF937 domain-containing protein [Gammaproteobacteria bacterium]
MDLMDLLKATGGGDSLGQLAKTVGLGSSDTTNLVKALAPALMRGMQKNTADDAGLAGLRRALETGGHDRYIDRPELLGATETRTDGNNILGHIFGSKDVSRNVAAVAAKDTGISASLIKKALPLLASLAMGAMSKKTAAGREIGTSASSGGLGPLGDLLGIGGKDDGLGLDDILGMARKFF